MHGGGFHALHWEGPPDRSEGSLDFDDRPGLSTAQHDDLTGRNKINAEQHLLPCVSGLESNHMTVKRSHDRTCACGKDCAVANQSPLAMALVHFLLHEVKHQTGVELKKPSLDAQLRSPHGPRIKTAIRTVCELAMGGAPDEQQWHAQDNSAAGQFLRSEPGHVPAIARGPHPVYDIGASRTSDVWSALQALAVKGPACAHSAFELAFEFNGMMGAQWKSGPQSLDQYMLVASLEDLIVLLRTALASGADPVLEVAVRFTVEHSKTAVDCRNATYAMLVNGLPQERDFPTKLVEAQMAAVRATLNDLPRKLGQFIADASLGYFMHNHPAAGEAGHRRYFSVSTAGALKHLSGVYECSRDATHAALASLLDGSVEPDTATLR